MRNEQGFTLVELVVALFIFGMLAAAGVGLLAFSVRAQDAAGTRLAAVGDERRLSSLLAADLAQAVPRVTRDAGGASVPAFSGTNGQGRAPILSYVRAGWTNPAQRARSGLQRVEIVLAGDRLERHASTITDGNETVMPTVLADDVERVAARYRTATGWSDRFADPRADALPRAAELTLTRKNAAPLTLDFLVATKYP